MVNVLRGQARCNNSFRSIAHFRQQIILSAPFRHPAGLPRAYDCEGETLVDILVDQYWDLVTRGITWG